MRKAALVAPQGLMPPLAPAQPFGTHGALPWQGWEHLGTCRRAGDEEWGFKVSPKPQMMLLPQLPSHGKVFLLQPGLVPDLP